MRTIFKYITIFLVNSCFAVEISSLKENFGPHPFPYKLDCQILQGHSKDEDVMIFFHGYGSSSSNIHSLRKNPLIKQHLVSFNFPDYNIKQNQRALSQIAYGTVQEILPALFVINQCAKTGCTISLHGFSAGGGAVINTLVALSTNRYDADLAKLGITQKEKDLMLQAVQKGVVILEVPLKSFDEILAYNRSNEIVQLAARYKANRMTPIDAVMDISAPFNILVHFQKGDQALTNRDDLLFIERLFNVNKESCAVIGDDGGHLAYHASLWKIYPQFPSPQTHLKIFTDTR